MLAVLVFSLTIVPETVSAQKLSKKERKRLKKEKKKRLKEMKKMSAADFQAQQEKQDELMTKASELESQLTATKSELSAKDGQVKQLEDKVRKLQQQVTQAQAAAPEQPQNVPMASGGEDQQYDQGLVFRVQIGAWQNQDLAAYDTSENFRDENGPDNMQMYTLGNFRDYWEADTFKKYLRKMGVRDAWIVPYENGERRPIKDVLEQLRNSASLN